MGNLVEILSQGELALRNNVKAFVEKSDYKSAAILADNYLLENPGSFYGKYLSLVLWGDYSYSADISENERENLRRISVDGLKKIMDSTDFKSLPDLIREGFTNEILYFTEQFEEQMNFGMKLVERTGVRGHYSVCVGASSLAKNKLLSDGLLDESVKYAKQSIEFFEKYCEIKKPPANIFFFVAQAYACLGDNEKALDYLRQKYNHLTESQISTNASFQSGKKILESIHTKRNSNT